jgi:hypothetical protein
VRHHISAGERDIIAGKGEIAMKREAILQPKYIGWSLFFLSLLLFFVYHVWSFGNYENALYQGLFYR